MQNKVLILDFWQTSPHLETSFELALQHLDRGDEVIFLFCGHDVPFKELVRINKRTKLSKVCLPELIAVNKLKNEKFYFDYSENIKKFTVVIDQSFDNIEDLRNFKYKSTEIGIGVLSSLIFLLKDSQPDLIRNRDMINSMLSSSATIYDYTIQQIKTYKPDLVYIFNGRFLHHRSVMNACNDTGTSFLIHERGHSPDYYFLRPFMPHDRIKVQSELLNTWEIARSGENTVSIAENFFLNNRNARNKSWVSFVKDQVKNSLPDFDHSKRLITYFSSSDDEFVAVGDIYKWDYWPNQEAALTTLVELCTKHSESIQLVIRIHPHVSQKTQAEKNRWNNLTLPECVILVNSDSQIDSYALIENSDIVVTSGSTVGIESVYWGTPSICLGPSFYSELGAVYHPRSDDELEQLLLSDNLEADRNKVLSYGYYFETFGEKFQYFKADGLFKGKFLGVDLFEPCWICRILIKLDEILMETQKKTVNILKKIQRKSRKILRLSSI